MPRLLMIFTLTIWTAMAVAQPSTVRFFSEGTAEGLMYDFSISADRAQKLPRWNPNEPLPLAIGTAVQIGAAWLKSRNPEIKEFEVGTVTVARLTYPTELMDRWYYRIEFNPIVGGQRLYGGQFTAVVLFDNTVVEPRVRKQVDMK